MMSQKGACLPGCSQVAELSPGMLGLSGTVSAFAATSCDSAKVAVNRAFLIEGCLPRFMAFKAGPLLGGWCGRTGHLEASFLACLVA